MRVAAGQNVASLHPSSFLPAMHGDVLASSLLVAGPLWEDAGLRGVQHLDPVAIGVLDECNALHLACREAAVCV